MPRLSAVPESPPRAIAYVRVSTARDDMVAPELQIAAIEEHCRRSGYRIVETIQDLDLSGRFWKRRQVERAIAMIEAGDADVLVTWKWSRVSRNRLDWAIAVDRVESAGGKLDSATEPVDTSTSAGRLQRGMLAEFAAFESDRIGDVWREVHARRTKAGLPANGKPRFGYDMVDGMHRPDHDTGPLLASLYRRYIAGESVYSLVAWLNREGYRTAPGYSKRGPGPWTQMTLRRTLDSGFGAGLILVAGVHQRGVHEPVIDEATWTAYVGARAARRTLRRAERSQYLLSGLVRCMYPLEDGRPCGSSMGGGQFGHGRVAKFRCLAAAQERRHEGGYVTMRLVEDQVLEWLGEQAAGVEANTDAALLHRSRMARRKMDAKSLAREVLEADKALARLTAMRATDDSAMSDAVWREARDELLAQREAAENRRRIAEAEALDGPPGPVVADLLANWRTAPVEHRRGTLRRLIARVEIVPGRPVAAIRVVPIWAGEK